MKTYNASTFWSPVEHVADKLASFRFYFPHVLEHVSVQRIRVAVVLENLRIQTKNIKNFINKRSEIKRFTLAFSSTICSLFWYT